MNIDMEQFHQVFFEESFEGIDVMEAELLVLQPGIPDSEVINKIFRVAHSIKGGAGTFGFQQLADFTHILETLLDEIRNGDRQVEEKYVTLLLKSGDILKHWLQMMQAGDAPDYDEANELRQEFNLILTGEAGEEESQQQATPAEEVVVKDTYWHIEFKPGADILKQGNDPRLIFHELAELGDLKVQLNPAEFPPFDTFEPESLYFTWSLSLHGVIDKLAIEEAFEWVADESEIVISEESATVQDDVALSDTPTTDQSVPEPDEVPAESEPDKQEITPSEQAAPGAKVGKASTEQGSIRVGIDKVDSLINMVGELVITQAMLGQIGEEFDESKVQDLQEGLSQLAQHTRELQENVLRIRMLPIQFVFNRFPRLVRDVSQQLGKKVELKLTGENTELDKTVMEKISDPLVHLVRNALDHGLEDIEGRRTAGKEETGVLHINAYHQGGNIIIEISDDGKGLNKAKILAKAKEKGLIPRGADESLFDPAEMIFHAGFSTADEVSELSGRGVGMDVVRRNIESLNGNIEVKTQEGKGSTFTIRLPLTLSIMDGQLVEVGEQVYILPMISIIESLQLTQAQVHSVGESMEVLKLREEYIPILRLYKLLGHDSKTTELDKALVVVVESGNEKVGLLVDDLLAQQQVVIKSLEENFYKLDGISGATILGDGTVSLILDINGLIRMVGVSKASLGKNVAA